MASKKNKTLHVIRPIANAWELWALPEGKKATLIQTAQNLQDIKQTPNTVLGFPVSAAFHLPVWLIRTAPEFLPDLLTTQVEKRGLLQGSLEDTITGTDICATTETHDLYRITVLPEDIDPALAPAWPEQFDIAARCFPFKDDSLVIWRELGTLSVAFVRGGRAAHFQSLQYNEISTATLEEIYSLQLSLEAQAVTDTPAQVKLWGDFSVEELQLTQSTFQGQTVNEPLPPPQKPSSFLRLTPKFVRNIKDDRARRATQKRTLALALALYLSLFALFGIYIAGLYVRKNMIASEMRNSSDDVRRITETRAQWNTLEPIIDPELSPIEMLFQTARLLPEEGVRFTTFEMDPTSITIQGEASSFPDASTFTQNVKENPNLTLYTWEDPNPTLLPNNRAQFQLLGRSIYAPIDFQ